MNYLRDQTSNLTHLRFFHAARGDGRCADAQARGDEGFVLIEGDRVFVDGDCRCFERLLGVFAGDAFGVHPNIDEHQVIVSATGNETQSLLL